MKKLTKIFFGVVTVEVALLLFLSNDKLFQNVFLYRNNVTTIPFVYVVELLPKNVSYFSGTLKSPIGSLIIYLHDTSDFISYELFVNNTWEPTIIEQFADYIKANPGIQVLDAGSNVGVYSLIAATLGSRVVSVDANIENTDRIVQSYIANNLTDNVTVVLNALSDKRLDYILSKDRNNIGAQFVIESENNRSTVQGIIMDDLLPLFDKDKPIIIKMDIQGKEIKAIQNATRLFDERNVRLVLIEWIWIKEMPNIKKLIYFFMQRNYTPYDEIRRTNELYVGNYKSWPYDVVWIKT